MGPNPVQVQILQNNDADESKNSLAHGTANYEDESYSVDLPVFSIHGNHDDPSRDAGSTELFAALDLLNVANLVNYFGKQTDSKDIRVDPICLKKGNTRVALYGLGSMRDERLNRMWKDEKIHFSRPAGAVEGGDVDANDDDDGEESQSYFNVFALHQNRDYGRGTKNSVKEDMIPEWMDLVCWGHEHECNIEVQESVVGTFRISQPGSSVATSLVAGEAERKKVALLDIRGGEFRLLPIPLTQVRSFVMGSVSLAEERTLDPDDPKVDMKVHKLLKERVDVMIYEADQKRKSLLTAAASEGNTLAPYCEEDERHFAERDQSGGYTRTCPLVNIMNNPQEVLVRLRVEHSGFSTVNNQRFGAKFVGNVANPDDILLFHRKKAESRATKGKKVKEVTPLEPEELGVMNIDDLVVEQLHTSDQKLQLFEEKQISEALEDYVEKQSAQAINERCDKLLAKHQKKLIKGGAKSAAELEEEKQEHEKENEPAKKAKRKKRGDDEEEEDGGDDDDEVMDDVSQESTQKASRGTGKRARSKSSRNDSVDDDDDDDVVEIQPKKIASRKNRSKSRVNYSEDNDDYEDDDDDEEVEIFEEPSSRSRGGSSAKRSKATSSRRKTDSSSDSDDNDDDEEVEILDAPAPSKKSSGGRGRDSTGTSGSGGLSQSTLSFEPVKRKTGKPTAASARSKATRKRNTSYKEDSDEYTPAGRSYDDSEDWGTA